MAFTFLPDKTVIPNSTGAIDGFLKEFRRGVIEPCFSSEKKRGLVEYVIFEALVNAWEHGNKKERSDRFITVCHENGKHVLTVSVEDQGEGFRRSSADTKLPALSRKRGRGLLSMETYSKSVKYNDAGNKVTIEFEKERTMTIKAKVSTFKGQVIILKPIPGDGIKEALDALTEKICGHTMKLETRQKISIIIDLSGFNIVSSTLLGVLGASIQEKYVRSVKLCGLQPAVLDTTRRLGLIKDESARGTPSKDLDNNLYKIKVYDTLEDGVKSLIPSSNILDPAADQQSHER